MKSSKVQQRFLVVPAAETWNLWSFGPANQATLQRSAEQFPDLRPTAQVWVALPSLRTIAVPMVLATTEQNELSEMIALQLEGRGIGAFECLDYSIFRANDRESVVVAWVLPPLPPEFAEIEMIARCVPSAFALALADNACTVWKEAHHWTCGIKSEGKVVAAQTLGADRVGDEMKSEVLCLLAQFLRDKILTRDIQEVVICGELDSATSSWPYPVRSDKTPEPIWPEGPGFFPQVFAARKSTQARQRVVRRSLTAAALLLAVVAVGIVGHTAWLWRSYQETSSRLAEMAPQVNRIKQTADTWNAVAPAVDPEQSGVEILYRCSRHLPAKGVRFTLFQIKGGTVLLVGEGDNVSGVVELQNRLANDKELAEYRWKMPPPRILPNNVARFEISGDRLGYVPVQK